MSPQEDDKNNKCASTSAQSTPSSFTFIPATTSSTFSFKPAILVGENKSQSKHPNSTSSSGGFAAALSGFLAQSASNSTNTSSSTFGQPQSTSASSPTSGTNNYVGFGQSTTASSTFGTSNSKPTFGQSQTFGSSTKLATFGCTGWTPLTYNPQPSSFFPPNNSTCNQTPGFVHLQSSAIDKLNTVLNGLTDLLKSATAEPQIFSAGTPFGPQPLSKQLDIIEKFKAATGFEVSVKVGPVRFQPIRGTDTCFKQGRVSSIFTRHQCITGKSMEEMRFEDYLTGRIGSIIPIYNCQSCTKFYENALLEDMLTRCAFHWEVNTSDLSAFESPTFHPILAQDQNWQLKLQTNDNNLSLHLINLSHKDVTASFSLSLLNQKHEKVRVRSRNNVTFKANEGQSGFVDFVDTNLQNQVLYNGKFTILCEVNPQESENLEDQSARLEEFDRFEKLLTNSEFSDVSVTSDQGKTYKLHKCVLASCSDRLKDLNEVKGVRVEVLDEFFRFVYTGRINSGILNLVVDLLTLAEKYEVEGLKKLCEDKMCKNLNEENAVEYLKLALLNKADKLRVHALSWMSQNLTSLVNKPEFRELGVEHPELLIELMKGRFGNN